MSSPEIPGEFESCGCFRLGEHTFLRQDERGVYVEARDMRKSLGKPNRAGRSRLPIVKVYVWYSGGLLVIEGPEYAMSVYRPDPCTVEFTLTEEGEVMAVLVDELSSRHLQRETSSVRNFCGYVGK